MAIDIRDSSAFPQILEGAGVNDGRRALEVAKTEATTRNKVIKLLLMIGVPAGLIAGVGSMIALNKSDGSLGNETREEDPSALVINEPNATGNVAALVTDINKEVAATTTLVSATTTPTKTAVATGAGLEGGDNPNAIPAELTKVDDVLAYAEEHDVDKKEVARALANCEDYSAVSTKILRIMLGDSAHVTEAEWEKYRSMVTPIDGYPKSHRVMRNGNLDNSLGQWLVVTNKKVPQKNGEPTYYYFAGIDSSADKSLAPRGFVRSGRFTSQAEAEAQLAIWLTSCVKSDQNLLAGKD